MGWAGKTLVSGSESDDTEAETVFHIILINLPSLSLWLGGDVACCSLQTLSTPPTPCKCNCGEGPQNERKQVLHQQAVWGWGWGWGLPSPLAALGYICL